MTKHTIPASAHRFAFGDRIHYSGDMANAQGWFEVTGLHHDGSVDLAECGGERVWRVSDCQIGDVYHGHCSPRFVTEAAVLTYRAARDPNVQRLDTLRRRAYAVDATTADVAAYRAAASATENAEWVAEHQALLRTGGRS